MWIVSNAAEIDGKLVRHGWRLAAMPIMALLNFVYADLLEGLEPKQRKKLVASLSGRVGPNGGLIVDDPSLPPGMQGMEMPEWYDPDEDPWSDTFTVD